MTDKQKDWINDMNIILSFIALIISVIALLK